MNFNPGRVWKGEATVDFGEFETEELACFQPKQMLDAYYISGMTFTNLGIRVLHDYLAK